jgi:hypothetical protein
LDQVNIGPNTNASYGDGAGLVVNSGGTIDVGPLTTDGSISLNAGTINFGPPASVGGTLYLNAGTINGVSILNSGTLNGAVTIENGVVLIIGPSLPIKGTYTGLFSATNAAWPERLGFFTARTTEKGGYSGRIQHFGG